MNKFFSFFLLSIIISVNSQQKLAFSFGDSPQTLMLNPGAETNFSSHYGVPILSNVSFSIGFTGFNLEDLFLNDSRSFKIKFEEVLNKLDQDNYINMNAVIDVLNAGFRLNDKTYVSVGFYEEIDVITYIPKDIMQLFYYGNEPFLNNSFSLSQISMKADILGVLHAGVSKKISEKLNIGARIKIYSSSLNIESTNNYGTFITATSTQNILRQSLNDVNAQIRTSGIIDGNNEVLESPKELFSNTFFGANLGLGLDVGLTYHFSPQLEFTGSFLDIGFVKQSNNISNYSIRGDYTFDGLNFQYDSNNIVDYWQEIELDFKDNITTEKTEEAYNSWRPMKINVALKYSFGEKRSKNCYTKTHKQYYYNSIGFQIHNIMRPVKPQFSFTSFYETSLSENIHTKFTHTINDYSYANFGAGASLQIGKLNVFGLLDNILGVRDLSTVNNISLNFGFNIVID
tara:strand:- start:2696 stop:4066 length:1371 start_codon:yes stop_codon:yes gene_type:complete